MKKYKLIKELPLAPVGTEVDITPKIYTYKEVRIYNDKSWTIAYINEKDIPLWLEEIQEEKSVWDIQDWDEYWWLSGWIYCAIWKSGSNDISHRDVWNCFLTYEEAEKELKKRKSIVKLNRIIDEKNWDWITNWKYGEENKYFIYHYNGYYINNNVDCKNSFTLKYAKDKCTMDFIIDNHKDLLDIVFDIK